MASVVLTRRNHSTAAAPAAEQAFRPIPYPPDNPEAIKADGDSFTFDSFTADDAWHLGCLLRQRLLPLGGTTPAVISVALANGGQVAFQCVTGAGVTPDEEVRVQRKRDAALRWGCSTWYLSCKFFDAKPAFRDEYDLSPEQAAHYAIHGGAVPILVEGVMGVVGVVVVNGLGQDKDHGVIVEVIKANWKHKVEASS